MSAWKEFEQLVEEIQRETAPDAIVRRDHRVIGKSGSRRQLDVTISKRIGMHDVFIVIECKRYKRKVTIDKVEAFASKLKDVGASQGVMISPTGFDSGAIAVAQVHAIGLQRLKEAQEIDWNDILGFQYWMAIIITRTEDPSADLLWELPEPPGDLGDILYNEQGIAIGTVGDATERLLQSCRREFPVGEFEAICAIDPIEPPVFIRKGDASQRLVNIRVRGVNKTTEYIANLGLASVQIVEDVINSRQIYSRVQSEPINWIEIINTQPGREISLEEYEQLRQGKGPEYTTVVEELSPSRPYVRLTADSRPK